MRNIQKMARARGWVMTLNNYTEKERNDIIREFELQCTYACIGIETGKNGTPHLQICAEFTNTKSLSQIKKICVRLHAEKRKGTKEEASNYCKKDGNFHEIGKLKNAKGKRTDLDQVKEAVKQGKPMREIMEIASGYQALRYAELCKKYLQKPRDWKPQVWWFYGKTGSGKTMTAFEMSNPDDRWVSMDSLKWWDGYDGQGDVIVDDFRGSDCRLKTLLRILDRYEYRVEHKGGSTQLLAKRIFITCPYHPEEVYKNIDGGENIKQLLRRIDFIQRFPRVEICDDDFDIEADDLQYERSE